jgi:uroporphyrinogen decarboxylase
LSSSIILTRSDEDNARTAAALEARGFVVRSAPMIALRPIDVPREHLERLATAVRGSTVLLTSAHATRQWLALRGDVFADDAPSHYLCVGSSSALLLAEGDPTVPILAVVPSASELAAAVPSGIRRLVYPCSRARRDEGVELFRSRGVDVLELPLYEPALPDGAAERLERALRETTPPRALVFFSPSAVANWFSLRSDIPAGSIFVAIGPTTAESLRAHGVSDVALAGGAGPEAIAEALADAIRRSGLPFPPTLRREPHHGPHLDRMNDQHDSLLLRALRGESVERRPVWMMRQAGRYLPEYRAVRATTSFLGLCRTPDLAAEVTIQPVDLVGVDAAIIFSDILVVPEAMGMELIVEEGKGGPRFPRPLDSADAIAKLDRGVAGRLQYVYDAIAESKKRLAGRVPLIGFAGAPLTLAAYMVEGHGSKQFDVFKSYLFSEPAATHALMDALAGELIDYLMGQVAAGANMLQLFDTWASILPEQEYLEFGLRHATTVLRGLRERAPDVPVLYFPKGVRSYDRFASTGASGFGIDWQTDIARAVHEIPPSFPLQGNLDPTILLSSPETIRARTAAMLARVPASRGYVANLGHGILPHTPVENARAFIDTVKETPLVQTTVDSDELV